MTSKPKHWRRNWQKVRVMMPKRKMIRNSAVEFLIFTAQDAKNSIAARYENETILLTHFESDVDKLIMKEVRGLGDE